jgi:hypothetical protein
VNNFYQGPRPQSLKVKYLACGLVGVWQCLCGHCSAHGSCLLPLASLHLATPRPRGHAQCLPGGARCRALPATAFAGGRSATHRRSSLTHDASPCVASACGCLAPGASPVARLSSLPDCRSARDPRRRPSMALRCRVAIQFRGGRHDSCDLWAGLW